MAVNTNLTVAHRVAAAQTMAAVAAYRPGLRLIYRDFFQGEDDDDDGGSRGGGNQQGGCNSPNDCKPKHKYEWDESGSHCMRFTATCTANGMCHWERDGDAKDSKCFAQEGGASLSQTLSWS